MSDPVSTDLVAALNEARGDYSCWDKKLGFEAVTTIERMRAALLKHACTCGYCDLQPHTHSDWCPYRIACTGETS